MSAPGSVSFYLIGATSPTNIVSNPNFYAVYFGASDGLGNFFLDRRDANGNTLIGEVIGGIMGTAISPLTTNDKIYFAGGVQVTTKGLIAIGDQTLNEIDSYNPPDLKTSALGNPALYTQFNTSGDRVSFAFEPKSAFLLTADSGNNAAEIYAYPAGGSPVKMTSLPGGAQIIGAAVNPPEIP